MTEACNQPVYATDIYIYVNAFTVHVCTYTQRNNLRSNKTQKGMRNRYIGRKWQVYIFMMKVVTGTSTQIMELTMDAPQG